MKKTSVIFVILMLSACAGRPSRATRTALDEVETLNTECRTRALAVGETAPSLEEGRARLAVERQGCLDRATAFCAAHHLDCTEVLR